MALNSLYCADVPLSSYSLTLWIRGLGGVLLSANVSSSMVQSDMTNDSEYPLAYLQFNHAGIWLFVPANITGPIHCVGVTYKL